MSPMLYEPSLVSLARAQLKQGEARGRWPLLGLLYDDLLYESIVFSL